MKEIRELWNRRGKTSSVDLTNVGKFDILFLPESVVKSKRTLEELQNSGFAVRTSQTEKVIREFEKIAIESGLKYKRFTNSYKRVAIAVKKKLLE